MTGAAIVLTTTDTLSVAETMAHALVLERLAACVQRAEIASVYEWEGEVRTNAEYLLLIKCREEDFAAIENRVRQLHNYAEPEILLIGAAQGSAGYLVWLQNATRR